MRKFHLPPKNTELVRDPHIAADDRVVHKGSELEFSGEQGDFMVKLVDIVSRDPTVVGRSTAVTVVEATRSDRWLETELVLKASWPVDLWSGPGDGLPREGEGSGGKDA